MIKRLTIKNFFSFGQEQKIELNSGTNVLVGINGTGKSNLIKAIVLLYESVCGQGMEKLLSEKWGGFNSIVNFGSNNNETVVLKYEFDKDRIYNLAKGYSFNSNPIYEITIHKQGQQGGYTLTEKLYCKNGTPASDSNPFYFLLVEKGHAQISANENSKIKINRLDELKSTELVLRQISDPDTYYPLYTLKKAIDQIAIYSYFDTTFNSPIRQPAPFYSENKLLPDGRNLAYVLSNLSVNNTHAYNKIIKLLHSDLNPNFEDLKFPPTPGGKIILTLIEKNLSHGISADHISDGTLRFLLLLSIFYNSEGGKIICIDEPEISLHPDMIDTIAEAIKYASQKGTQVIAATHSPLLLNSFELEDIKVFEKDATNQTVVSSKSEEDFKDWEGEFLAGQMWLRGQLGGTRW